MIDLLAVGRQPQGVGAVLAVAAKIFQPGHFVELVVAVGVAQPIERAGGGIVRHIQRIEGEEQPLGRRKSDVEPLDARRLAGCRLAAA